MPCILVLYIHECVCGTGLGAGVSVFKAGKLLAHGTRTERCCPRGVLLVGEGAQVRAAGR